MSEQETKQNSELKQSVLSRIEGEQIQPRSKMWWHCQECLVWILWGASIIFGALSAAILIFVSQHAGYALYEATHESIFTFIVDILPLVWLIVFIAMSVLAYFNLRNTKQGYKYSIIHVIVSSLIFSIVGGVLLHFVGMGYSMDSYLGRALHSYASLEEREVMMWQNPEAGRLIGMAAAKGQASSSMVIFHDIDNTVWMVRTLDLHTPDMHALHSGKKVRILGLPIGSTTPTLHACGVFPWMMAKDTSLQDIKDERKAFVERMYAHKDRVKDRAEALNEQTFGERAMGLCADMPTVRRIGESMR